MKSGRRDMEDRPSSLVVCEGVRGAENVCLLLRFDEGEGIVISNPVIARSGLLFRRLTARDREEAAAGVDRPDFDRRDIPVRNA